MTARLPILIALLMTTLALAGCFSSDGPLFTDDQAVAPYARIAFVSTEHPEEKVSLVRKGNIYFEDKARPDSYRFMPLGDDLYVAEQTDTQGFRLYGLVRLDATKHVALVYASLASDDDVGPDLPKCEQQGNDFQLTICIKSLDTYIAHAKASIASGEKPAIYKLTLE